LPKLLGEQQSALRDWIINHHAIKNNGKWPEK